MARITCLANIPNANVPSLLLALERAEAPALSVIEKLDVRTIGRLSPMLLVCDLDDAGDDGLELLRRLRFVLPETAIAVYTRMLASSWARDFHLAGANGVLSQASTERELAAGVRATMNDGCFTDPRFATDVSR